MRRINSIKVPAETRKMLRERLARFLPTNSVPQGRWNIEALPRVSDQELVDLILNLNFLPGDDISRLRELYEQAAKKQPLSWLEPPSAVEESTRQSFASSVTALPDSDSTGARVTISTQIFSESPRLDGLSPAPLFDELVERGWIRVNWERVSVPGDIVTATHREPQAAETALKLLIDERHRDGIKLREGFNPEGELRAIADDILSEKYALHEVSCVSRAWVAARLWDAEPKSSGEGAAKDAEQRLSRWIDRWELLKYPSFPLGDYLEQDSYTAFIDVAMDVLAGATTTPGWEEFRDAALCPVTLLHPGRERNKESIVSSVPETTVGRTSWMGNGLAEQTLYEFLSTRALSVFGVLLNEIQHAMFDPLQLASRLMKLVLERPVLLQQLIFRSQQAPILLADMLMAPETSAVACRVIANWEFSGGAWNQDFQINANLTTKRLAFEDAMAVLGGHIDAELVPANELAALYQHIYELTTDPRHPGRYSALLSLLRQELTAATINVQNEVFDCLVRFSQQSRRPRSQMQVFCAALDLISDRGETDGIDPTDIVLLYLDELLPQGEELLQQFDLNNARSFLSLVLSSADDVRNRFFNAVDIHAWLDSAPPSPDEQYSFQSLLARRIRLHTRLLSRAVGGWATEVPDELVNTLAFTIHAGATDHLARGRVDAFVPGAGFGLISADEPSIALDLAVALRRLQGDRAQRLVMEICQISEPIVLADIIGNTDESLHQPIKTRLQTLTPENSSEVHSWPILQARVEALLNAGLQDAAEVFIAAERDAKTFGPVPGRAVTALRNSLRMLLLRQDWTAIESYQLPDGLDGAQKNECGNTLLFYQGIVELKKTGGNPKSAEAIFLRLKKKHPSFTSYHLNIFASRVSFLLNADSFRLLSGEPLVQARRYLNEAKVNIRPLVQHSPSELKSLDINRAMLLLAAGQPRESLQVLMELRDTNFDVSIEGFRALAMARLDQKKEALVVLTQAEHKLGRSEFLSAIRENIDTRIAYSTLPSLALDDDPVPGIRQAFEGFLRLGPTEQAGVLQSRGSLDLYLLEVVRESCAGLVAVAPMMRELGMVRYEDDISGVLKQILLSRLQLTQWAVEDQSRGGFSKSGGVGERDLVISKGQVTLAVIEALAVKSVDTNNLESHFNKLLGYGTCRFFFHITYVRNSNCAGVLAYLKTACATPPRGIGYIRIEDLEDFDSMPIGFKAHYKIDSRDIVVVFLALEIGQNLQREAAALTH